MKRSALRITPGPLEGELLLPSSKSHTMRALLLGALGEGVSQIHHYLPSPDTEAMIKALQLCGVSIEKTPTTLTLHGQEGRFSPAQDVIDAGNSGQVLRFMGSLCALTPSYTVLTGDASLRENRPVQPLLEGLSQLGAVAFSTRGNGRPPLVIRGPLSAGVATLDGKDSQPISGLLMASAFLEGTTHLHVTSPGETPWIDLTLAWLHRLKGKVDHHNYSHYTIQGPLRYPGFTCIVPGDWSSAAFPLAAALVTRSSLSLSPLDLSDPQGDKKILDVLQRMGARWDYSVEHQTLSLLPSPHLQGICLDINPLIDALPILAVLGCFAESETHLYNGAIARKKESDRIGAITAELRKMGARIEEHPDGITVQPSLLSGTCLESHQDHRIALALLVAALGAQGPSLLRGSQCMEKSFPGAVAAFRRLGAQIEEKTD